MEIEFNTSHTARPVPVKSADRQDKVRNSDAVPFDTIRRLEEKLKQLPDIRPEKVAEGREQIADVAYPPDEMLDSIANLLAMRIR